MRHASRLLAGVLLIGLISSPTLADPRWGGGGDRPHGEWHGGGGWHGGGRGYDPATNFWGGVVGGWLWSQFNRPEPPVVVVPAAPQVPEVVPFTPAWYAYCAGKYRSFDPASGSYLGYDGIRHQCQ